MECWEFARLTGRIIHNTSFAPITSRDTCQNIVNIDILQQLSEQHAIVKCRPQEVEMWLNKTRRDHAAWASITVSVFTSKPHGLFSQVTLRTAWLLGIITRYESVAMILLLLAKDDWTRRAFSQQRVQVRADSYIFRIIRNLISSGTSRSSPSYLSLIFRFDLRVPQVMEM